MSGCSLLDEYGIDNCKIIWMEVCPGSSKKELDRRVGEVQKANACVNKNIAGKTAREYNDDNVEMLRQKTKTSQERKT